MGLLRRRRMEILETGQRFGRWTVMAPGCCRQSGKLRTYLCHCECGTTKEISYQCLKQGASKSCGCRRIGLTRTPFGTAAFNTVFAQYRANAKSRNLSFALTKEEFRLITNADCFYCGALPSNVSETTCGHFIYSGIDRRDNSKGYFFGNCVPCCARCNEMKTTESARGFIDRCAGIAERFPRENGGSKKWQVMQQFQFHWASIRR